MKAIPIVDLSGIQNNEYCCGNSEWAKAAEQIRVGLGSVGFLYLTNHGIPEKAISGALRQSEAFFNLPLKTKEKFAMDITQSAVDIRKLHGFRPVGGEKLQAEGKFEMKETFDWQPWGTSPTGELPEFQSCIKELDLECRNFLKKFYKLLALSLKLDNVEFFLKESRHLDDPEGRFHLGLQDLRMLHYPPIDANVSNEKLRNAVRCGQHADYWFLTLLFQDDIGGLEVKTIEGEWVHAKPIPGSVLVNTGNLTEFWTCGIFPATPHRIVIPKEEDERRSKSRYSIAFFTGPDCETIIRPVDMEKRPVEEERFAKTGKVYSKAPIKAYDYSNSLLAKQYGQA